MLLVVMKPWRYALSGLFLACAPVLLFSLISFSTWRLRTVRLHPQIPANTTVAAAEGQALPVPLSDTGLKTAVAGSDARPIIIANFLERHSAPLTPYDYYGQQLVDIADRYNLDYRLLPAIMMQESNLCKSIPPGSYNCLGFGVHARGTLGFESYEAGFDRAAREIKERYVDIGLTTPEKIMTKYTPSSNGSWAFSVNQWIVEMEYNDREKARQDRQDNNLLEYTKE
jgi:hypothetical protein